MLRGFPSKPKVLFLISLLLEAALSDGIDAGFLCSGRGSGRARAWGLGAGWPQGWEPGRLVTCSLSSLPLPVCLFVAAVPRLVTEF